MRVDLLGRTLNEHAVALVNHIQVIEGELQRIQTSKTISEIAKEALVRQLIDMKDTFETAPLPETEKEAEPTV